MHFCKVAFVLKGETLLYLHKDHLGSIQAYSDKNGKLVQELSYDAWGRRRSADEWKYYLNIPDAKALHDRGFTGHEHLDMFEMINMNGRMYDPMLGRFLSPDPFVQAPDFTQGLNRYIYCLNNPLSLVDPSGYSWFSKNWKSLVASVVGITVAALVPGGQAIGAVILKGALGGMASGLAGALLNGSNIGQIAHSAITGGFWGAASAAASFGVGEFAGKDLMKKLLGHSMSQGTLAAVQGGNFKHGFISGLVSAGGGYGLSKAGNLSKFTLVSANAIIGGTASELGGGKFANGAITGAYVVLFNDLMHQDEEDSKVIKSLEIITTENGTYAVYYNGDGMPQRHLIGEPGLIDLYLESEFIGVRSIKVAANILANILGIDTSALGVGKTSTKGLPHGDGGRALSKTEDQIKKLENQLENAVGKDKKIIQQKIKNIRETAQKKAKGETHWRK